ncbi:MAG TPA: aldo/keto reductase [Gemmatimonadales bacterium]|nr:aldo/keto reductase [Gemmatimonadales bacterium]
MTQQSVEFLIGKLVTDEELREAFQQNPRAVLVWLLRQGLELSSLEMEALKSIEPSDLSALAELIDRRLQRASLRRRYMTRTVQDTETLPTTPLGTTGMRITRVGFGAWAIGGGGWTFAWGGQDDADSIAAIRHAVERGINWIDTAAVYGLGHSEEVVARALRDIPADDRPYVFTKAGLVWDERNRAAPPRRVGDPRSIRLEIEASLRRLDVERIDLYQMHWPAEDGTPLEDYWGTLLRLKEEGKVRAVGLSNHDAAQLETAERIGHVDTLQPPFSAIRREVAAAELPWCAAHRTGVIAYSPMQSGLLTGAFNVERAARLGADDWRSRSPDFTGLGLRRNVALADALRPIAERHGVTVAAVAVAWTLAWPGVTAAIVGARSPGQVDGWIGAATLELADADLDDIAAAIRHTGAGTGPVRP